MKFLLIAFLLSSFLMGINGLECYQCASSNFDTPNCYIPDATTSKTTCPTVAPGRPAYCSSQFTIEDGIVTSVDRGCSEAFEVPASEFCSADLNTDAQSDINPVDRTTCSYACTSTDNCNKEPTTELKKCSTPCANANGYCDYIQGACVCYEGYSGSPNCILDTTTFMPNIRKCIQCNSEIETNCNTTNGITSTSCEFESFCYSAQTWLMDESNKVVKNTITRGCTSEYIAADECSFSNNADTGTFNVDEYFEYTCVSTCTSDGCNKNNPDGVVDDNEEKPLKCVQCSYNRNDQGTVDSCSDETSTDFCSDLTATHCYSNVTYWMSERNDGSVDYELLKVVRGCANEAKDTKCTTTPVHHLTFKQTTCQEYCNYDGCNTGWPARPKCFQCHGGSSDSICKKEPSYNSAGCDKPYDEFCITIEGQTDDPGIYGYSITKACSHKEVGNGCNTVKHDGLDFKYCNKTCSDDYCNKGNGAGKLMSSIALALLPALLMGWM